METFKGFKAIQAKTRKDWRKWLDKSHQTVKSVWLVIYHKTSETKSVYYDLRRQKVPALYSLLYIELIISDIF